MACYAKNQFFEEILFFKNEKTAEPEYEFL